MFGLELHPAVVHFPLALGVTGALALLAYAILRKEWLRWFGPVLLSLALAGAGAAYFSGESAHDRAESAGVPHAEISRHEETAIWGIGVLALATLLGWASAGVRRGAWMAAPVAVIAAAIILWAGHLGGRLVFIYGAGHVKQSDAQPVLEPGANSDRR
ncbi:MAG TPA: DUF2231 domain-containing protein [Candidatus Limnocylindrales bacterium]|nr:DUF2231 domain-containing protein [Candidatus Limnocylindrales bacterium]